jgi:hypothetical protein
VLNKRFADIIFREFVAKFDVRKDKTNKRLNEKQRKETTKKTRKGSHGASMSRPGKATEKENLATFWFERGLDKKRKTQVEKRQNKTKTQKKHKGQQPHKATGTPSEKTAEDIRRDHEGRQTVTHSSTELLALLLKKTSLVKRDRK